MYIYASFLFRYKSLGRIDYISAVMAANRPLASLNRALNDNGNDMVMETVWVSPWLYLPATPPPWSAITPS